MSDLIAFIGVGNMGNPMAQNLVKAGKKVKVFDVSSSMIDKAKKAASEIKSKPNIMMVTILTALSDSDLKDMGNNNTVNEQVRKLAKVAKETGVGVVCSGHEAKIVREIIGENHLIFTPGIRMTEDGKTVSYTHLTLPTILRV